MCTGGGKTCQIKITGYRDKNKIEIGGEGPGKVKTQGWGGPKNFSPLIRTHLNGIALLMLVGISQNCNIIRSWFELQYEYKSTFKSIHCRCENLKLLNHNLSAVKWIPLHLTLTNMYIVYQTSMTCQRMSLEFIYKFQLHNNHSKHTGGNENLKSNNHNKHIHVYATIAKMSY